METKALVYQSWDELVFENRNKLYGAYAIRRTYNNKVLLGMGISVALLITLLILPKLFPEPKIQAVPPIIYDGSIEVEFKNYIREKKQEPAANKRPVQSSRTNTPPIVTTAPVEELPIVQEPIAPVTDAVGEGTDVIISSGIDTDAEELPVDITPKEFVNPEVMPTYKGGYEGMMNFLRTNLRYPKVPLRLGIEGTVFVSFLVMGDGSVADVSVVRGIHPDCDKEAIRVISKMKDWSGGKQGGLPVRVRMILPIKFKLL